MFIIEVYCYTKGVISPSSCVPKNPITSDDKDMKNWSLTYYTPMCEENVILVQMRFLLNMNKESISSIVIHCKQSVN